MLAANYSTVRNNLKEYCDMVVDEAETLIVTRRGEKNVVMISLGAYNAMMKSIRNAAYLNKLERSFSQIENGNIVSKTMFELEAMEVE